MFSLQANQGPFLVPLPPARPPLDESLFHQYEKEQVEMFVPVDSSEVLNCEMLASKGLASEVQREKIHNLRDYYKSIPQLNKMGPDGITKLCSSGVTLTLDLMVGYMDEVIAPNGERRDVLNVVVLWSNGKPLEGDPAGWVLPGKRDQAYDPIHPDICIKEANFSLVEKEIGINRSQILHHAVLGYFDDRIRDPRFKGSTILSFVLLDSKPQLEPGKRIGLPLNGLKLLAERRIDLAPFPERGDCFRMARNHDSIILAAFRTAKFYHTMEKVKLNQARFREMQRMNPLVQRPPVSNIDPGQECPLCFELLVNVQVICARGHSICGICLEGIRAANSCSFCREPLNPRPNLIVDHIIRHLNPDEYVRRHRQSGAAPLPPSWEEDMAFRGNFVSYKS